MSPSRIRHFLRFLFCDNLLDAHIGQAIGPVKGHEYKSYKTPCSIASLFFNFTHVKMKGQNKRLNEK